MERFNTQRNPKVQMSNPETIPALGISILPSYLGILGFELPAAFISPGGSEFLLIMLVLILLFGAKDAPRIFRGIHNALDKMQRAAASFRYKIMYGDLGSDTTSDEPYDVEEESSESGVQSSELDANQDEERSEKKKTSEPGTEDSELPA